MIKLISNNLTTSLSMKISESKHTSLVSFILLTIFRMNVSMTFYLGVYSRSSRLSFVSSIWYTNNGVFLLTENPWLLEPNLERFLVYNFSLNKREDYLTSWQQDWSSALGSLDLLSLTITLSINWLINLCTITLVL